jgi:orotate phosphoribosyltransferase
MTYQRPSQETIAKCAVQIARLTLEEIDKEPAFESILGTTRDAIVLGAIVADAIADVDESTMRVRDAIADIESKTK